MLVFLILLIGFVLIVVAFINTPKFGKLPVGDEKQRIRQSAQYKKNQFENQSLTPMLTEGGSYTAMMKEFFFGKRIKPKPKNPLPSVKNDLKALDPTKDLLVWFGHSSYFMQLGGKTFLVDPVLSGAASPLAFTTPSFSGSDVYSVDDFPIIDVLLITHDHWDHLDYDTVTQLKPKVKKVITSLGVGSHLRHWGYTSDSVIETDWHSNTVLSDGFIVHTKPARHFSGRGFTRNQALWSSFVLQTPTAQVYVGGDSGYDTHFKAIGDAHGPFDIALLECGQYNKHWKHIHMMPEETVQAAVDLKAKRLMPVHWGKFMLSMHPWDEPISRATAAAGQLNQPLVTPKIGEIVFLHDTNQQFEAWWQAVH
jgi:L-ascorbate metabolism protein UlaG (beta-lactamase superfamily)